MRTAQQACASLCSLRGLAVRSRQAHGGGNDGDCWGCIVPVNIRVQNSERVPPFAQQTCTCLPLFLLGLAVRGRCVVAVMVIVVVAASCLRAHAHEKCGSGVSNLPSFAVR
eukprot:1159840-Pelagomonas_calceolata.AAC.14